RPVPTADLRALPNSAASSIDSQVMLVILIPSELFIEKAKAPECVSLPATEIDAVRRPFIVGGMTARSAHGERRLKGRRNGSGNQPCALGNPWSTHIVCLRFLKNRDAQPHIIRRVFRVRIHSDNHRSLGRMEGRIESSSRGPFRIVYHPKPWLFGCHLLEK